MPALRWRPCERPPRIILLNVPLPCPDAVRLELNNGSGNVDIRGSADGKVHIVGKVTAGWSVFGGSEKGVQEVLANPPVEQR